LFRSTPPLFRHNYRVDLKLLMKLELWKVSGLCLDHYLRRHGAASSREPGGTSGRSFGRTHVTIVPMPMPRPLPVATRRCRSRRRTLGRRAEEQSKYYQLDWHRGPLPAATQRCRSRRRAHGRWADEQITRPYSDLKVVLGPLPTAPCRFLIVAARRLPAAFVCRGTY
jgi:hypothetical protein